jgi:uncharacterized protein (DUF111 family)
VKTGYGSIRVKTASGRGIKKSKPEYDDLAKIALENGLTLAEAAALLDKECK